MDIDFNLVKRLKECILENYKESLKLDKNVKNKELNDIVTDVDIFMETKIIEKIREWFPEHSIIFNIYSFKEKRQNHFWISC